MRRIRKIPAALAGVVDGVVSLHDFRRHGGDNARRDVGGAAALLQRQHALSISG